MSRPFGSKNRRHRVADRDKRRMHAVIQGAVVGRAFADGFREDADGKIGGTSARNARRVLQMSMVKVSEMSEDERQRLASFAPPPAPGTRMRQALDLRLEGLPYAEIADAMGVAVSTAFQYVAEGLERLTGEEVRNADVARRMQLLRLDALLHAQWSKALAGSSEAALVALRILERQSKLLGLDAPQKVDISHRLRLLAEQEGLDYEELLAEAQAVIKRLPK